MKTKTIDPIRLELIKNALASIADEMAMAVLRTGRSTILKESMDFSTALINRRGELIAQGLTIPQHLGSMPDAILSVLRCFEGNIHPGDVYILNDPYGGGMHLPDIFVFKPIFRGKTLLGFTGVVAHHTDVGGRVPGSHATDSTEIYQEGLRIPLLKLWDRGIRNDTVFSFIEKNVRLPQIVLGDLAAQIAACGFGEREYLKLADKYGVDQLERLTTALLDYTERLARLEIAALKDGDYAFTDYIDDDGLEDRPLPIKVCIRIRGDKLTADFTGSTRMSKGALNATYSFTKSCVYLALRCMMKSDVPNNAGYFRPIQIIAPPGTIVHVVSPGACAARGLTGFRMADTIFGALSRVVPEERRFASGEGGNSFINLGGYRSDGRPFIMNDLVFGAQGGRPGKPNGDAYPIIAGGVSNLPCEVLESEYPVRVHRYAFVPDTGGAGTFRGGLSIVREYELLTDEATLQVRSDRRRFLPWPLAGGKPGAPSQNRLARGGEVQTLPSKFVLTMRRGDVFTHVTGSGAGYGSPRRRTSESIRSDLDEGRVTPKHVRAAYGVTSRR